MAQQDALGTPVDPGRVHLERHIAPPASTGTLEKAGRRAGQARVVRALYAVAADDQDVAQPWRSPLQGWYALGQVRVDDQHFGFAVVGDKGEGVSAEPNIGRHGHAADAQRAEQAFREPHVIRETAAARDCRAPTPRVGQQASGTLGTVLELEPSQRPLGLLQRDVVRVQAVGAPENVAEIARIAHGLVGSRAHAAHTVVGLDRGDPGATTMVAPRISRRGNVW